MPHYFVERDCPEAIRKVAELNGLPAGRITQVGALDPCSHGA